LIKRIPFALTFHEQYQHHRGKAELAKKQEAFFLIADDDDDEEKGSLTHIRVFFIVCFIVFTYHWQ